MKTMNKGKEFFLVVFDTKKERVVLEPKDKNFHDKEGLSTLKVVLEASQGSFTANLFRLGVTSLPVASITDTNKARALNRARIWLTKNKYPKSREAKVRVM